MAGAVRRLVASALVFAAALLSAAPAAAAAEAPDPQLQREFVEGARLLHAGDYAAAAGVFRALLERTGSPRVRLELARALYHLGEYREARALFRQVLLDRQVPWEVRDNVEAFVRAIDDIEGYVRFSASVVSDTNPRNITSQREFTIGGFRLEFQPPEDAGRVTGLRYGVQAYQPLAREARIGGYVTGSYLDYPGSSLDRLTLDGGVAKLFGDGGTRVRAGVETGTFGARRLYEFPYVAAGQVLSRSALHRLEGEVKLGRANFPRFGFMDARHASAQLGFTRALSDALAASLAGAVEDSAARERPYSYRGFSLEPGIAWLLPEPALLVRASFALGQRNYAEPDPLFGIQRRDRRTRLDVSVRSKAWRFMNLAPGVLVSFERTQSSIDFFSTRKVNFAIALE